MLTALNDNVLLEVFEPENKSEGGIIIPLTAQEKQDRAIVISVGELVKDKKIQVGAQVFTVKGAAQKNEIKEGDKKFFVVKDYDILAFTSETN